MESFRRSEAIRLNPANASSYAELGGAYILIGQFDDAINSCKTAIRCQPGDARSHLILGCAYLKAKDRAAALDEYAILKKIDQEKADELFRFIYP